MTAIKSLTIPDIERFPAAGTPVLLHRELLPSADTGELSIFADDRWDLAPGIFEAHYQGCVVNFADCPPTLRPAVKRYMWELINHAAPQPVKSAVTKRLSLLSVRLAYRRLLDFLSWLDVHGITSFDQVTHDHLDRFLTAVLDIEAGRNTKGRCLTEVRRLWSYRDRLPASMRLPAAPPWENEDNLDLLGTPRKDRENATERLHPNVMQPLLMWCLRFVDDFADDIIAASAEHQRLQQQDRRFLSDNLIAATSTGRQRRLEPEVSHWLAQRRQQGAALPGQLGSDGGAEIHWRHLSRIFGCSPAALGRGSRVREMILASGLPVADGAYLDTQITGRLHGQPWRNRPITYHEAPGLSRLLAAACAVVIGYLSGMRPGELLNLRRGCITQDPVGKLWLLHGRQWKGAVDDKGEKVPGGIIRQDPWTIIEPVARAVDAMSRLHPHDLLFPNQLRGKGRMRGPSRTATQTGGTRTVKMTTAIGDLITWVNNSCRVHHDETELIPADPSGPIALSRFRRTLAWHIVRRPRGLIAGAIQYGHLHVQITLGYAGSYESGFPDDHAYEEWLHRVEQLAEQDRRLKAGETVSGPAATAYRQRVTTAHEKFAGRVLRTNRQAHDLLANPLLQIYPGRAITCVFDPDKALCQVKRSQDDSRRTPDPSDCRPNCANIAYTDPDIGELQIREAELRECLQDRLAPSIRSARQRNELDRISAIIRRHNRK